MRVDDPSPVGDWSPIYRFTKTWATSDNKPDLLSPVEGENLAFFDSPAFSWTPVIGAARYRFQIATSPFGFDHTFNLCRYTFYDLSTNRPDNQWFILLASCTHGCS